MAGNSRQTEISHNGEALHWPGRVVTAQALERNLNGHRRLVLPARAIITPLAQEHLRANGIQVDHNAESQQPGRAIYWGYAQEREHPLITSAVQALAREGMAIKPLPELKTPEIAAWAKEISACVAAGQCCGGVIFCSDPGLFCCVSNKVPGLRGVSVNTVLQAVKATTSVGANLLAVEMPGRTFFEIRQILRLCCAATEPCCPPGVACTLKELDGHAHR